MADIFTPAHRSRIMAAIRPKNTQPEMLVRRVVFSLGYRYRLHYKRAPGKPDLAFPGLKKAIFVHGCFWHVHEGCVRSSLPKTRATFWLNKLRKNVERDRAAQRAMSKSGWKFLVLWQCEIKDVSKVAKMVTRFLGPRS